MADGFLQFGADGAVAHAMADFTAVTLGSIEKFADGTVAVSYTHLTLPTKA